MASDKARTPKVQPGQGTSCKAFSRLRSSRGYIRPPENIRLHISTTPRPKKMPCAISRRAKSDAPLSGVCRQRLLKCPECPQELHKNFTRTFRILFTQAAVVLRASASWKTWRPMPTKTCGPTPATTPRPPHDQVSSNNRHTGNVEILGMALIELLGRRGLRRGRSIYKGSMALVESGRSIFIEATHFHHGPTSTRN